MYAEDVHIHSGGLGGSVHTADLSAWLARGGVVQIIQIVQIVEVVQIVQFYQLINWG
jgi:hypothetical protein